MIVGATHWRTWGVFICLSVSLPPSRSVFLHLPPSPQCISRELIKSSQHEINLNLSRNETYSTNWIPTPSGLTLGGVGGWQKGNRSEKWTCSVRGVIWIKTHTPAAAGEWREDAGEAPRRHHFSCFDSPKLLSQALINRPFKNRICCEWKPLQNGAMFQPKPCLPVFYPLKYHKIHLFSFSF